MRNLTGKEIATVIRRPSVQSTLDLKIDVAAEASGNKTRSGAQQSSSTPISRRKSRTVSLRRKTFAFSNSPASDGRIITVAGMMNDVASSSPERGRARAAGRNTSVQNMDTNCAVVGKLILRMKLKA